IKEEPRSDGEDPTNMDISLPIDHTQSPSVEIKEEEEDFPPAGIRILKGIITDSDIHSFTITGEYIRGRKVKTKPKQEKVVASKHPCPVCKKGFSTHGNMIKEEDEGSPAAGIDILKRTITDTDTITGENKKIKLMTKPTKVKGPPAAQPSKNNHLCPVCKRNFSSHGNMEFHNGKKLCCPVCGAEFCNKMDLKAHVQIHKVSNVLYCAECNVIFPTNLSVLVHEKIHTGGKPFCCSHCGNASPVNPKSPNT
ncbi:hypothetical protein AB205_0126710, partial [Aquarana catesbeiana]